MADHEVTIERYMPEGSRNYHYIALCSCSRWRSQPYREQENAELKGLAHSVRGDAHNRALAAADHGNVRIQTVLKHYKQMASDPFLPEKDKEWWRRLADELAERLKGDGTEQDVLW